MDEVRSVTENAYRQLDASEGMTTTPSILSAVKTLCALKGVGPATATLVLGVKFDGVPFMSDEAMLQVFNGDTTKLKYDMKTCRIFIDKINGIVGSLGDGMTLVLVFALSCFGLE